MVRSLVAVALVVVAAPTPAYADPVPDATYHGVATDGATVSLTVSSDGTIVTAYNVIGAHADTCTFYGEGDPSGWVGAPIASNAFRYQFYDRIMFAGTFPGPQSAAGTFRFYDVPQGGRPACDTGTVSWTATTTAKPSAGTGSAGGGAQSGSGKKRPFVTRVVLHKLSKTRIGGHLSSSKASCRAGRTVILWRGTHRIASTKTKANGTYTFTRPALWRNRRVRASATVRYLPRAAGTCAAGSSSFIKA
jgi:hypothetical protein